MTPFTADQALAVSPAGPRPRRQRRMTESSSAPAPHGGPLPGVFYGPHSGPLPGVFYGPHSGPLPGVFYGPHSGPLPGVFYGPHSGPLPGVFTGHTAAPLHRKPHVYTPVVADDTSVSVREFRANLADYLRRANAGETITVTRAGRVDAELGPPTFEETSSDPDD